MDFFELATFLNDNCCDSQTRKYDTANLVTFAHASIYGNSRTVVFSNPVMTLTLHNIIHTKKTELSNGSTELNITCEDIYTGEEYYEKIILSSSHRQ